MAIFHSISQLKYVHFKTIFCRELVALNKHPHEGAPPDTNYSVKLPETMQVKSVAPG